MQEVTFVPRLKAIKNAISLLAKKAAEVFNFTVDINTRALQQASYPNPIVSYLALK